MHSNSEQKPQAAAAMMLTWFVLMLATVISLHLGDGGEVVS